MGYGKVAPAPLMRRSSAARATVARATVVKAMKRMRLIMGGDVAEPRGAHAELLLRTCDECYEAGSLTQKRLPEGPLSTPTSPLWACTRCLTMARPRPVPPSPRARPG